MNRNRTHPRYRAPFSRNLSALLAALLCLLPSPPGMAAGAYETAKAAWLAGEYHQALRLMQPLAERGDARAQAGLALIYAKGLGTPRDARQATLWYARAARAGLAQAQYDLAARYFRGDGTPRDAGKAVYWWRQAARSGLPEAQYDLGLAYERGIGTARDAGQAMHWYLAAARQGHGPAQYALGVIHANAQGARRDLQQALRWFEAAAQRDVAAAQYNLGLMRELGRGAPQDVAEAIRWYRRAAKLGLEEARLRLARYGLQLAVTAPADPTTNKTPPRQTASGTLHRRDWILRQDPAAYTLQIASGVDETALRKLLLSLSSLGEIAYFKQLRSDGGTRFIALLGVFASRRDAERVRRRLPEALSRAHPWARRFASIQGKLTSP